MTLDTLNLLVLAKNLLDRKAALEAEKAAQAARMDALIQSADEAITSAVDEAGPETVSELNAIVG